MGLMRLPSSYTRCVLSFTFRVCVYHHAFYGTGVYIDGVGHEGQHRQQALGPVVGSAGLGSR